MRQDVGERSTDTPSATQSIRSEFNPLFSIVLRSMEDKGAGCVQDTNHQVACAQEQHHAKDVDHAGGKNAVPGAEENGLPHKQLDPPPWLAGLLEALIREAQNVVAKPVQDTGYPCDTGLKSSM